jgi:hypothetical protein
LSRDAPPRTLSRGGAAAQAQGDVPMTEPSKPSEEQAPGTNPGPKPAAAPQPPTPGPQPVAPPPPAAAPQPANPGPKAAAIPPIPNPGPKAAASPAPPQAPPGAVNPNPTPGFPASVTLPLGQQAAPAPAADVKAAEKAQAQREAQAEHDARAAEEGVVAGKGGGTVEVQALKDSTNKDGSRKQRLFVTTDGLTTYAPGPGQVAVAHDPDPATQMFGAPEDREDAAKE